MADVGLVYKSKISRSVTAAPGTTTSSSTARKLLSALNSTQASVTSAASSSQVPNETNKHAREDSKKKDSWFVLLVQFRRSWTK